MPAVSSITGAVVVLIAGLVQLTAWKARRLADCEQLHGCEHTHGHDVAAAWRYGLRLGLHCSRCCASLMAILLVFGVMDLRAMTVVTLGVTAERLPPSGARMAHVVGFAAIGAGLVLFARNFKLY